MKEMRQPEDESLLEPRTAEELASSFKAYFAPIPPEDLDESDAKYVFE